MFAKKFLSIVSFLFIGSQFISSSNATALFSCPSIDNECEEGVATLSGTDKYCISGGKIYQFKEGINPAAGRRRDEGECLRKQQVTDAGTYVFEDDGNGGSLITLGNDGTVTVTGNLKMYTCSTGGNSCSQAYGYVSIGSTYYSIPKNSLTLCSEVTGFAADDTGVCDNTSTSEYKYCLDSDKKIYKYKAAGDGETCSTEEHSTGPNVFVFEDDGSNGGADLITLGTSTITSSGSNLMIYQCSNGSENKLSCSRTYGYIYDGDGTKYYAVKADGTVEDVTDSIGTNNCATEEMTGKLHDTNKLCLFGKTSSTLVSGAIDTAGTYIMNNVEGNVFTSGLGTADASSNKSIVIQATTNVFYLVPDDYDYCITDTDNSVTPTFKEFCTHDQANANCSPIAECTGNLCKRGDGNNVAAECAIDLTDENSSSNCKAGGYYLGSTNSGASTLIKDTGSNGYLIKCESAVKCDVETLEIGYYKYAGYAHKYIQCSVQGSACSVVDVVSKNDCTDDGVETGGIINNSSGVDVICLDTTVADGVVLGATADYFVPGAASDNIFNSSVEGKYVKVSVDANKAILADLIAVDANVPKYQYTDDTYKVYGRDASDKSDTVCKTGNVLVEFKHDEDDNDVTHNYYKKHVTYEN